MQPFRDASEQIQAHSIAVYCVLCGTSSHVCIDPDLMHA